MAKFGVVPSVLDDFHLLSHAQSFVPNSLHFVPYRLIHFGPVQHGRCVLQGSGQLVHGAGVSGAVPPEQDEGHDLPFDQRVVDHLVEAGVVRTDIFVVQLLPRGIRWVTDKIKFLPKDGHHVDVGLHAVTPSPHRGDGDFIVVIGFKVDSNHAICFSFWRRLAFCSRSLRR